QTEGGEHDLLQSLVSEDVISVVDRAGLTLKVEREAHALVFLALAYLERLTNIFLGNALLSAAETRCCVAVAHEIEGLGKGSVALVRQPVGKGIPVIDPFSQNLLHEGLGIDHVLEAQR